MKSWCRSGQSCFKTCDLTLTQLSLSLFPAGLHCNEHTRTHAHSHLSDTDSLLSALERALRLTLSALLLNGGMQPRADRAAFPLEPSAACVRRRRQGRGVKLPVITTVEFYWRRRDTDWRKERKKKICTYVADTAVIWWASHFSNPEQFVTQTPGCFCFWWMFALPRISKGTEQRVSRGGNIEKKNWILSPFMRCSASLSTGILASKYGWI